VYVIVDYVPISLEVANFLLVDDSAIHSFQRDITLHKCIRRLWDWTGSRSTSATIGTYNSFNRVDSIYIQAHPYLDPAVYKDPDTGRVGFKNIGEITMVFAKPTYYQPGADPTMLGVVGFSADADTEPEVFIDPRNDIYQRIFNYLTVFDPSGDEIDNDDDGLTDEADDVIAADNVGGPEWKIPGRININTAPWYVLAQLPWVSLRGGNPDWLLAQAIVNERETANGFKSVGELMNVPGMEFYAANGVDEARMPDLTPKDDAPDDLEERDLIFARISNLVTVRSDVFTAYILVRIGRDGPQRRMIAILDRSDVYPDPAGGTIGTVKLRARHPVHDPR